MSEDEILALRREKLERLRQRGLDPYPPRTGRTHSAADAVALLAAAEASGEVISVAGRITAFRNMGKAAFADLRDGTGRVQAYFKKESLGVEPYEMLLHDTDLGDFIAVSGRMFRTKTGEATIEAQTVAVIAKALRPPPEKWHGLQDIEARYRHRHLDLMANPEVRAIFETRSRVISAIRRFMEARGYLEVETPILQSHAGGAAARPFKTHHNTLERDLYLRIALELHLKRLVVGGFDRVFEIGRIFRNEGVSTKWNPEFTMMESYEAYTDYNGLMDMVETMVSSVAGEVLGSTRLPYGDAEIDFSPPWPRTPLRDAILEGTGVDFYAHEHRDSLADAARAAGLKIDPAWGRGKIIDELLTTIETELIQPVFLIDYPVELSPLAKRKPGHPSIVERFEFFIAGREIGNAYTELNDPVDQRERLVEQARLKAAGDDEVEVADEEFLVALEHGMPPTAGLGIGIDRLVMALTNSQSIREVILFPALRDPR